jgi:hypothetical protein
LLAQRHEGVRAMRRTERLEGNAQLLVGHLDVSDTRHCGPDQRAGFVVGTPIVRRHQMHELAFGLLGYHLEQV